MSEEPTLYEAMYILDTELADNEVEEQVEQIENVVTEAGGEVVATRDFRTRRLAYEIDEHTHGTYKLLYFHGSGEVVTALNTDLNMRTSVIRGRTYVANPEATVSERAPEEESSEQPAEAVEPPAEAEDVGDEEAEE